MSIHRLLPLLLPIFQWRRKVDVLKKLPEGLQAEVVLRVSNLDFVSPELIAQLDDVLKTELIYTRVN
jgi:flagellar motor switch protein FliG